MENKDKIKELFQDRFKDFESDVNPSVWDAVQTQITSVPVSTGMSLAVKSSLFVAATVLTVAGITYFGFYEDDSQPEVATEVHNIKEIQSLEKQVETNSFAKEESIERSIPNAGEKETFSEKPVLETKKDDSTIKVKKNETVNLKLAQSVSPSNQKENRGTQDDAVLTSTIVDASKSIPVKETVKVESTIKVEEQSTVVASPMGGRAPLQVSFSCLSELKTVKWKFDDGVESDLVKPTHEYTEPGIYFVTMIAELENGNIVMDKAIIEVRPAAEVTNDVASKSDIFVPNIFTPNGDGLHDVLNIETKAISSYTVAIYSVNGTLVYSGMDSTSAPWNGCDTDGEILPEGTYYYLIEAKGNDGKLFAPKGYITLRRSN